MAGKATKRKAHSKPSETPAQQANTGANVPASPWRTQLRSSAYRLIAVFLITLVFRQLKSDVKELRQQVIPFKVVDLPGRGKGMIATRLINQGERIMTEKPLFTVPISVKVDPVLLIESKLNGLAPEERAAFFNLSHAHPDIPSKDIPLSILQTNGIAAGNDVGIFPKTARLNHGCSSAFNSVYSWRPKEGILTVHALKEIPEGEELLTTYFDTKRLRDQRREHLADKYNFRCGCKICSLPLEQSQASDKRLQKMSALYKDFQVWSNGEIDGVKATQIARQIWQLGDEEGYWSERGQLAADAAHVAAAHSDERATRQWAALAHEWYSHELGADSEQVATMVALLENPRRHYAWGTRERINVEVPPS